MNDLINKDWIEANYSWHTAILAETVEALNHTGWEWWRHEKTDIPQIQMELVDIWHFMLASYIEAHGQDAIIWITGELQQEVDGIVWGGIDYTFAEITASDKLHLMASLSATGTTAFACLFESILADFEMDWQDLFLMYMGKNTLNKFRNHNGYKANPRTYIKDWFGAEDNTHLSELLQGIDANPDGLQDRIYAKLQEKYFSVLEYNHLV